jgi:hypothetical protein
MNRQVKSAGFEVITPERAKHILETQNISNRRMRSWWSEAMAQSMKRGEFKTTHQGIAFSEEGYLLDGQHRLSAIVKAGVPVEMLCVYGLDASAFGFIDIGIKRNVADLTGLSKRTAETCRLASGIVYGLPTMTDQIMKVAECGLQEVHDRLIDYSPSVAAITTSAPVRLSACLLVMDGYNEDQVFEVYRNLNQLNYSALPSSALSFLKQKEQGRISASRSHELIARATKALNPNLAQLTKIQIDQDNITASTEWVRRVLRRAIGKV